ncbi:MAG: alpha/beta hydrolase family protein [Gemmataceae bacterium]
MFRYEPVADQSKLPEFYRLDARSFDYRVTPAHDLPASGIEVYRLTFPSPVTSDTPQNNTVHAEYYRPKGPGRFPGVVILDITGGDQSLSRGFATYLAQNNIGALFVQMAYYGPRRPPGSKLRLLSTNVPHSIAAVRQTVLDVRVAGAWLASRPEIDASRLGIMGTSLGSFIATLAAETDPRFMRLAVLLGGGGLVDAFYDHPQAAPYRKVYELTGGTKEKIKEVFASVDPITLAGNLRGRSMLMLCASRDEIVPPSAAKALWEAAGRPTIRWYDTTHYGAALFIPKILPELAEYFTAPLVPAHR